MGEENKTERLTIRVEPSVMRLVQQAAKESRRDKSEWARKILLKELASLEVKDETEQEKVVSKDSSTQSQPNSPCICGHYKEIHQEDPLDGAVWCALCVSGESEHSYTPDFKCREVKSARVTQIFALAIRDGDDGFEVGQKLPSTRKLSKQFLVSHQTVAAALRNLSEAGLVRMKQGKEAVVIESKDSVGVINQFGNADKQEVA